MEIEDLQNNEQYMKSIQNNFKLINVHFIFIDDIELVNSSAQLKNVPRLYLYLPKQKVNAWSSKYFQKFLIGQVKCQDDIIMIVLLLFLITVVLLKECHNQIDIISRGMAYRQSHTFKVYKESMSNNKGTASKPLKILQYNLLQNLRLIPYTIQTSL
ncbi:unnamed protein product [Paramecium octaurelia]|uniref:Uncharacterized protein n=1 Tax=Paramecium octaurelia TaxID=43137 RepID=A0A8S1VYE9_PAROT|nr:unnamed protein product [Paramecium octaurelia]